MSQVNIDGLEAMHSAFDALLAGYLREHPKKMPSTTSCMELMQWSYERIERAKADGVESYLSKPLAHNRKDD